MILSPLTLKQNTILLKTIQSNQLTLDWEKYFQINILEELKGYEEIYLYQCNTTKLKFFVPFDVAASNNVYEQLEKYEWYYREQKWEYDIAIQNLVSCQKVLEVGCGQGYFIERLGKEMKIEAQGIELNRKAVNFARSKGLSVSQSQLQEFAHKNAGLFDAVCAFQVLEHVPDPLNFLKSLVKLVKAKGKIIIAVPNSESFLKHAQNNLLDQPPHHMTQWCRETFNSLHLILPIQVQQFRLEPLAQYHIDWYLSTQLARFPKIWPLQSILFRVIYQIIKPLLKKYSFMRSLVRGHTLYVCLEKIE